MKKIVYNKSVHESEKKEREVKTKEAEKSLLYRKSLASSPEFKKYIVRDIFEKRIFANSDVGMILKNSGGIDIGRKQEVADLVIACHLTAQNLKRILKEILGDE